MSYQVLALKYRPQTFEEVVGQDHVTTTLTNAITADRVAHAILLTGPRGTGKTTIARILAKAMTCAQGPTPVPCNTCKICRDIIHGHCADVFEIDGASNNSVEQIRDLRENVTYMPASARFKIYIIDEVHMLSVAAFNALLKTLEEPPEHVLFIFATTEVHKIPATILSRCQRHDLARVPLSGISGHLARLCGQEGFSIEKESLDLIALEADGSIRDSLSLLDRILSSSPEKTIDHGIVVENLGVSDRRLMFDLSSAVFGKDGAALIEIVERVNDSGLDLKKFYADIISHFRNLNIIKLCGRETSSLNLIDAEKDTLAQAAAPHSRTYLGMLLQRLLDDESLVRFSSHTQTAVEMVLLKLIQISPGARLDKVIEKLDTLARHIDSRVPDPVHGPPAPGQPGAPQPGKPAPQTEPAVRPPAPTSVPNPEPPPESGRQPSAQPGPPDDPGPRAVPAPRPAPKSVETAPPVPGGQASWTEFMAILQTKLPFIFALFSKGRKKASDDDRIVVVLNACSAFEASRLKTKNQELQALARTYLGKAVEVEIGTASSPAAGDAQEKAKHAAARHPMVQEARRIFDGEIL